METDPIRERLRCIAQLVAEIMALLPGDGPHLTLLPDDPVYDLPSKTTSSRARGDVSILRQDPQVIQFPGLSASARSAGVEKKRGEVIARDNSEGRGKAFLKKHKEISKMPKKLQQKIKEAIMRPPRYHHGTYEKRATINGIRLCICAANRAECEELFLQKLLEDLPVFSDTSGKAVRDGSTTFSEWARYWFEEIYKPNVTARTYENEYWKYKVHILPFFGDKPLKAILPSDCLLFFNKLKEKGIERTAESCYGLMNRILSLALKDGLIKSNPMDAVARIKHERTNGVPLSREEERAFIAALDGQVLAPVFLVALYTGIRPCEYEDVTLQDGFIVTRNRKQKNVKKIVYKKIPITPMLRPYLKQIEEALPIWKELTRSMEKLHKFFKRVCPGHRMYDLRTTFATRTQETGVAENVVQVWLGQVPTSLLGKVYTKFSDEFLLSEGEKVRY